MAHLQDYAERSVRVLIDSMPPGQFTFEDVMDDDGFGNVDLPIRVAIEVQEGDLVVDFTGTAPQTRGGINAVRPVTVSAVYYVVRCLIGDSPVPTNAGIFRPLRIVTQPGTLVDARFGAAVAAGNVETSQRIVDVVLGAFGRAFLHAAPERAVAASQGTMNNITIGGIDPRSGRPFAYYETVAGGMGGSGVSDGLSGVHVHMTNTLNTPAEALEYAYPLRVTRYELRRGSGGAGRQRGGDGLIREIELLGDATVTLLSERRRRAPYGLDGGGEGKRGENWYCPNGGEPRRLGGKATFGAQRGDRVRMETPGGGGTGVIDDPAD